NIKKNLIYKMEYKHRNLQEVDRFYASSKTCSKCGALKKDLTLRDRVYKCPECGFTIDRDLNAAINLRQQIKNVGAASSELKPAELTALLSDLEMNGIATSSDETGIW
ncbi:Putative transposase DNA-binding domain-containing protein, partial [Succinivibrio dextrinosolvens]|uniref:zinc ribbon domain-containing protein n=3 Tax=Succinivibrio TaxID=83770 RepID=UPI0008E3E7A1